MENLKIDIDKRTYDFGVKIVKMVNTLPKTTVGIALGNQVIRSGTSIGANVQEAIGGMTKKEFIYHMNVARKEARETKYWLRIIQDSMLLSGKIIEELKAECEELISILTTIVKKSQKNYSAFSIRNS